MAAGLLVLPGAGQEHRGGDAVDEGDGGQRVAEFGRVVGVVADLGDEVGVLQAQLLVRLALGVAAVDAALLPALPVGAGLVDAGLGPLDREAGVQQAAGVQRGAERVVEHAERSDGGQARGNGGGDEQLADAGVRDAHHADLVVECPRLGGDRFDDVVAVEALHRLEEAERAAAAAGATHVHAHVGEAEGGVDLGEVGAAGVARLVAAVLDDRGVRALVGGAGQDDVGAERGAVTGGDVAEAALGQFGLRRVPGGVGVVGRVGDGEGFALLGGRGEDVAVAGGEAAEQQRTLFVDHAGRGAAVGTGDGEFGAGLGIDDGDLFGAGPYAERGRGEVDRRGRRGLGGSGRRVDRALVGRGDGGIGGLVTRTGGEEGDTGQEGDDSTRRHPTSLAGRMVK